VSAATASPTSPGVSPTENPLLEVRGVTVRFGGVVAVDSMSFNVARGEICGLVGPNGAGKTTLFNSVTRTVPTTEGTIRFAGADLAGKRPEHLASIGIRRTFQNLALFDSQDVLTNVLLGLHSTASKSWIRSALRLGTAGQERECAGSAVRVLELLGLAEIAREKVGDLPFGTLKRVELARALVSEPQLILLDEPANGLRESEVRELREVLRGIRDELGVTILLVDHHVRLVMTLCDSVVAMAAGQLITHGTPAEVRSHDEVRRVFLGGGS
jgi:branched-chain amino acid transport system ATP-binding protein